MRIKNETNQKIVNHEIKNNKFYISFVRKCEELDYRNFDKFSKVIKLAIDKGFDTIYVDCANLAYIDSSGLGKLINFSKNINVVLSNVSVEIHTVFRVTRTEKFFEFR